MRRAWQRKPLKDIEQYVFYLKGAVRHADEELPRHEWLEGIMLPHWRVVKYLVCDR